MNNAPPTFALPCAILLVAAGRGQRFGGDRPKQYQTLAGLPLVVHTLRALHRHPLIHRIQPVIAPDGGDSWAELAPWLAALPKVAAPVSGGSERQQSVHLGLRHLALGSDDWVGIHDGVRPLVSQTLLDRLLAAREGADALIPALAAQDTVKQSDGQGRIAATLDRSRIHLAQTPQLFRYGLVLAAHRQAEAEKFIGTDDASLVERLGRPVLLVPGEYRNIKITHPEERSWAEALLGGEA